MQDLLAFTKVVDATIKGKTVAKTKVPEGVPVSCVVAIRMNN